MAFKIAEAYVQISQKGAEKTYSAISRIGAAAKKMGAIAGVGVVATSTALLALAKSAAATGDDFHKMALRTGASTEALSELAFAAEQSGSDIDTVERGFKGMARSILNAERGLSTSVDSFDMIGLSIQQLQGLNPEDQFTLIAQKLSEVADPTQRAALSMQIFGKAGADLGPLLQEGASGIAALRNEANSLGRTVTQTEADNAAAFTDSLNRLQSAFGGVTRSIGSAVIPYLTNVMDAAQYVFNNWGVLVDIAGAHIYQFAANGTERVKTWATNAVELVQWFSENWRSVMADIGNATQAVFKNLANNAAGAIQRGQNKIAEWILRTQNYLSGQSESVLNDQLETLKEMQGKPIEFKGLLDGFRSSISEVPKLTEANIQQSSEYLDGLYSQLIDKPASTIQDIGNALGEAGQQVADGSSTRTESRASSSSMNASSLVNSIQQSALSKQEKEQKKQTGILGTVSKALTTDGIVIKGGVPAVAG